MPSDDGLFDASSLSCDDIQDYDWNQFLELGTDIELGNIYHPTKNEGEGNKPGDMGIPLAWNTCGVFDPETGEELGYNQVGEWAVLTDTAMLGYFGSASNRTQNSLKVHADGRT